MRTVPYFLFLIFLIAPVGIASPSVATYDELLHAIRQTRAASQARIEAAVEEEKVREAWETGKLIDEHILLHKERANYGEQVLSRLAGDLAMSRTELYRMLEFARAYPIVAPAQQLTWAQYRELIYVKDPAQRKSLTEKSSNENWTRERLRKEIRRQRLAGGEESTGKLPVITPGPFYTYQIIRLKDRLKIDLGLGIYHGISEKDSKKFKEGDIVTLEKGKLKKADAAAPAQPVQVFTYPALVTQVVDGDTFHALIDLGFEITLAQRVRLRRIDAPEIETAEGKEAKALLEKILFRDNGRILIQSHDLDQHGRPLADVWVKNKPIDQELLDQGLAVVIEG